MGRKPVLALAGALVTSVVLAGCQTTSSSRPVPGMPNTAANQTSPKTTMPGQPFNGVAANQNPQNGVGPTSGSGNAVGQQQPITSPLNSGQPNLTGQQTSFNGQVPGAPTPVQNLSNRPVSSLQPANFGSPSGSTPAGVGGSMLVNSSFPAPSPGPSLAPNNAGTPIGFNSSSAPSFSGAQPTNISANGPISSNYPYGPAAPNVGSTQPSNLRMTVPDVGMPPTTANSNLPSPPPSQVPTRVVPNDFRAN
jgi:hypothetical protein